MFRAEKPPFPGPQRALLVDPTTSTPQLPGLPDLIGAVDCGVGSLIGLSRRVHTAGCQGRCVYI